MQQQKTIPSKTKFIGIDGLGASGKTTIALKIKEKFPNVVIVHTDDYRKPPEQCTEGILKDHVVSPDFDWDRMEEEIFIPPQPPFTIKGGVPTQVGTGGIVIVVGVYALQKRFFDRYDLTVWVETSRAERIKRMIAREGEEIAKIWQEKWMLREENYQKLEKPEKRAMIVLRS